MTARSGGALSHVNFQARQKAVLTERQNAVLTESQRARILAPGTGSDPHLPQQAPAAGASVPVVFAWRL